MVYVTNYFDFESNLGIKVNIKGIISKQIWQHLTIFIDSHPYMHYFDLEDGHQIVLYSKDYINYSEMIEIVGEVIKAETKHKNPRSKITDEYFEYQVIVDSWKCL